MRFLGPLFRRLKSARKKPGAFFTRAREPLDPVRFFYHPGFCDLKMKLGEQNRRGQKSEQHVGAANHRIQISAGQDPRSPWTE